MLQIDPRDVVEQPFPHIVKQGILPGALYERLRATFPGQRDFEEELAQTQGAGSRVGKGTGFDIYRGDAAYDHLIARSDAWAELDGYINSSAFVGDYLRVFGAYHDALGCTARVEPVAYDSSFVEPRRVLTARKTVTERLREIVFKFTPPTGEPARLFTRLDIEKSVGGYGKPPHCDRANRLCSLIVYFTDTQAAGIEGGELNLYRQKNAKKPRRQKRHPAADTVEIVAKVAPKENLGVFFPCSNNSYHGVDAIRTPGVARDFLYINISVDQPRCW
jgi:hypothetical protein